MHKIKIGVWDEEIEYVSRLADYLQKYGKGKWDVRAFTDVEMIQAYIKSHSMDLLLGTDRNGLNVFEEYKEMTKLWLTDEPKPKNIERKGWYALCRFQGADNIAKQIKMIVTKKQCAQKKSKQLVAIYSPIGRCGKTTFALDFVKEGAYGRWLYVGMEDYSSFGETDIDRKKTADEFFYYWKTHNEEQVMHYVRGEEDVIVSGNSFFDSRQVNVEDLNWLRSNLESSEYNGVLFDMGSGVLQNFRMLEGFDIILVPFMEEEYAQRKRSNFEWMFHYQEMDECKKKIRYLNMTNKNEREHQLQHIFGGDDG